MFCDKVGNRGDAFISAAGYRPKRISKERAASSRSSFRAISALSAEATLLRPKAISRSLASPVPAL